MLGVASRRYESHPPQFWVSCTAQFPIVLMDQYNAAILDILTSTCLKSSSWPIPEQCHYNITSSIPLYFMITNKECPYKLLKCDEEWCELFYLWEDLDAWYTTITWYPKLDSLCNQDPYHVCIMQEGILDKYNAWSSVNIIPWMIVVCL